MVGGDAILAGEPSIGIRITIIGGIIRKDVDGGDVDVFRRNYDQF